jgi:archaeal flagellar protein FlaF
MVMGLETVVVAFFVIGTILVVACALTTGANHLIKSSYDGYNAFSQTTMDRLHTYIKIYSTQFNATTQHVHLTVVNTGETKLSNYNQWDVFVVDNGTASDLTYGSGFSITFINDLINPGIFDPQESIDIELLPVYNSGDSLYITVVTENGISSSTNCTVS